MSMDDEGAGDERTLMMREVETLRGEVEEANEDFKRIAALLVKEQLHIERRSGLDVRALVAGVILGALATAAGVLASHLPVFL